MIKALHLWGFFYFHKELRGVELRLAARLEQYKKGYTHSIYIFGKIM